MINYLSDKNFLKEVCSKKNKILSIKITSYTKNNEPIEAIEGKVTTGSINIDGSSNTRRSCSLTIQTENLNIHDFYWSLTTCFSVEIGIVNTTNQYINEKIIWFPMGYYIISSFSMSLSTTGASVSIQGKDKMSMLNGDLGGKLGVDTDFGVEDIIDENNNLIHRNIPIKQIIKEMVHTYGQEAYSNININDVDDFGLNLETYRKDTPCWIFIPYNKRIRNSKTKIVTNELTQVKMPRQKYQYLKDVSDLYLLKNNDINTIKDEQIFYIADEEDISYFIRKISYGDTIGYLLTDLIYAGGDLIGKAGETVTSILDKIKNMLGNFEYFYDINGIFVFQEQKAYKSNGRQHLTTDQDGIISDYTFEDLDLTFTNLSLLTSLTNNVQINNLKNDFTVWGQKKTNSGSTIPIHMRYAIDQKPKTYRSLPITQEDIENIYEKKYKEQSKGLKQNYSVVFNTDNVDWREIIYQMAQDYKKLHFTDEYVKLLKENNLGMNAGKTGYEQYYTDLDGFWRTIYHPYWDNLNFNQNSNIDDLFLKNHYYQFIKIHKNQYGNDEDPNNFYLTNNLELKDKYNIIQANNIYEFNNKNTDKFQYLYGPLVPSTTSAVREFYGNLEDIINQNYKILFKFYLSKFFYEIEHKQKTSDINFLSEEFNEFKETAYLYYYDPMTCVEFKDNINEQTLITDNYTTFYAPTELQCYHKICSNGQVEKYWAWEDINNRTGKLVSPVNLFKDIIDVYEKVFYTNENNERDYSFKYIGKYIPFAPNKKASFTKQDEYNFASIIAKDFLRSELKLIDPEEQFNILIDFEEAFNSITNKLSEEKKYGILALYYGIVSYYIPLLLSFLLEKEVTMIDIQLVTENSNLSKNINQDWENNLFKERLLGIHLGEAANKNELFVKSRDYYRLIKRVKNLIFNKDLDEDSLTSSEQKAYKILKDFFDMLDKNSYYNNIAKSVENNNEFLGYYLDESFSFEELMDLVFNNESEISKNNIQLLDFIDENLIILKTYFSDIYNEIISIINLAKEDICNTVLNKLIVDVNRNQDSFKEYLLNNTIYLTFKNQMQYNFSKEILTSDQFNLEYYYGIENSHTNFITQYKTQKDLIIDVSQNFNDFYKQQNNYFIFDKFLSDDVFNNIIQGLELFNFTENNFVSSSTLKEIYENAVYGTTNKIITNIVNVLNNRTFSSDLIEQQEINSSENYTDPNLILIIKIIQNLLKISDQDKKIITWPKEFDLINFWHIDVTEHPENLLFWFDFLDNPNSSLQKYSVKNIGQRAFVKNDNQIKVIKYLPTENIVLVDREKYNKNLTNVYENFHNGYCYINLNNQNSEGEYNGIKETDLTLSANGKSAFTAIENLLYNYGYAQESININCIPQYFLQPNTKIAIYDDITKIDGEYIINKITIPLSYNGMMSISATRAVDKFERSEISNDK